MDEVTRLKICETFEISQSYLEKPPEDTMERLMLVRTLLQNYPPPETSAATVLIKTANQGRWISLKTRLVIGSSRICDLTIRDEFLSGKHCMVEKVGDDWMISDLASRNGILVNDTKVFEKNLINGDIIQIGGTTLIFIINMKT